MRKLYIAIVILLISLILVSSYNIFKELQNNKEQEAVFEELIEMVEQVDNESEETSIRNLKALYEINNDFVGWLSIEDTTINYPVVQSKDKSNYYLKRDFYKQYSSYGTPYISEQCEINQSDNIIIYGHNMKNKSMFGALENYKSKEYYDSHQHITFETLDNITTYEIFAVFKTIAYNSNGFRYYDYINFNNEKEYKEFIEECNERSFYKTNKCPEYGNKLLTLSTCEYSSTNGRLVVIAYEI